MAIGPTRRKGGSDAAHDPINVDQRLRDDPAFQVLTVDGLGWICPFTGNVVPAPFGFRQPAREWLLKQKPWQRARPLASDEVQTRRWEHWLKSALLNPKNDWLRWFLPDGRWLNPFTGELLMGVEREGGRITMLTVTNMARILRSCPQAQGGQPLQRDLLESRLRAAGPPSGLERRPAKASAPPAPTPSRGENQGIHGYRILSRLGAGAMGTVFKAVQISLQREVALKVIELSKGGKGQRTARFLREARAAARINHPNVVTCYDVGEHEGRLYMALELVTGGDAGKLLLESGGRLDERRGLEIARDCARGLQAVAAAGLVHRDIKPENIFIAGDGTAKLGDLGLVRAAGLDQLSKDGALVGTPAFMAPEQTRGGRDIDVRADLYAIGATLFALITGDAPFPGDSVFAVMNSVVNAPIPNPRDTVPGLSSRTVAILTRCLAKDRQQRFQSPADLVDAIDEALDALTDPGGAVNDQGTVRVDLSRSTGPEVAACGAHFHRMHGDGWHLVVALPLGVEAPRECADAPEAIIAALPADQAVAVARIDADGQLSLALSASADALVIGTGAVLARRPSPTDRLEVNEVLMLMLSGDPRRMAAAALLASGCNAAALVQALGTTGSCVAIRFVSEGGPPAPS